MAVAGLMGFVSGVIGELWINTFLAPEIQFRNYSDLTRRLDELTAQQGRDVKDLLSEQDFSIGKVVDEIRPAVVTIYPNRAATTTIPQLITDTDILGTGFVLTSDGWVVTAQKVVADAKASYAVRINNRLRPVTAQVVDLTTGVVFLKIEETNLPVVNLGSKDRLTTSQSVLVATPQGAIERTSVTDGVFVMTTASSVVHSSESYYRMIKTTDGTGVGMLGAPVFSLDGQVFGMVMADDGTVLPIDYIAPIIKTAVKQDKIARPVLGVRYIDVEQTPNLDVTVTRGAYLIADALHPAVAVKSPAAQAGLKAGDVIVKVDADEVNRFQTLSQLIMEYSPGAKVSLTIERGGQEQKVDVTLGSSL
jgi:serine protease Do